MSTFYRGAAQPSEILRENVSFQFLSLRHCAEILSNTPLFARLPDDTRSGRLRGPKVSHTVTDRHIFVDSQIALI
jgi:hypothetical protein